MRTKAYQTPRSPLSGERLATASESSDAPFRGASHAIRSALIARRSSLRAWARAWAERSGRDPQASYDLLRMTLRRRVDRGLPPIGRWGRAMVAALRLELGTEVVPWPEPTTESPADARRRPAGRLTPTTGD